MTTISSFRRLAPVAALATVSLGFAACLTPIASPATSPLRVGPTRATPVVAKAPVKGNRFFSAMKAAFVGVDQPGDGSVNVGGSSVTLDEVVPIPGGDMIKSGSVQEGSLFQNSFHSPTEGNSRAGSTPTTATVIFKINRP